MNKKQLKNWIVDRLAEGLYQEERSALLASLVDLENLEGV